MDYISIELLYIIVMLHTFAGNENMYSESTGLPTLNFSMSLCNRVSVCLWCVLEDLYVICFLVSKFSVTPHLP